MKRLVVASLLLSVALAGGIARAQCVTAGDHGEATVTFEDASGNVVRIYGLAFGNFAAGPVEVCDDASATPRPTTGYMTITINGTEVCRNSAKAPGFDPFGFGGSIRNAHTDPCGADAVWNAPDWFSVPSAPQHAPDPVPVAAGDGGAHVGTLEPAYVSGEYWTGSGSAEIPFDTVGWFSNHGVQVATS